MTKFFALPVLLLALAAVSPRFATGQLRKGADACFDKNIKTIQLRKLDGEMTDPVITLGSGDQLQLSFDDLSEDIRYFSYKIALCDAGWSESNLFFSDYIEGFLSDQISNREPSFNTLVGYTRYTLEIPNAQMQLKLSGNYLLKVYDSDKPDEALLQKSFSVVEPSAVGVRANVRKLPLAGNERCSQQLDVTVEHPSFPISQPYTEVKVRVEQNGHRFLEVADPTPTFVRNGYIDYSHPSKNLYPGGSEYRHFDISSLEYKMMRVREVLNINNIYHVQVEQDEVFRQYLYNPDINGRYVVRNERYLSESNTQSDYPSVFLSLHAEQPLDGKIYVFGEISGWELNNDFVMLYDSRRRAYELSIPVKQGYYNYKYVYVDENGALDMGRIDACSSETENIYGVYVYYRGATDRHDRLLNVTWVSSQETLGKNKSGL
ncbi:MAG: DUF5103 domain-containing protein [Prevotellaceae bacterium]|jgi:hypothetical protein|nr:DUF5103 domain-containing protein [Prevotellaceae bacterium]